MKNDILIRLNLLIKDISKDNNINISDAKKVVLNVLNNEQIKQLNKNELKDFINQVINNYYLSKQMNIYNYNIECFIIRFKIKKDYENKRFKR